MGLSPGEDDKELESHYYPVLTGPSATAEDRSTLRPWSARSRYRFDSSRLLHELTATQWAAAEVYEGPT
jgi:hypothetical protein